MTAGPRKSRARLVIAILGSEKIEVKVRTLEPSGAQTGSAEATNFRGLLVPAEPHIPSEIEPDRSLSGPAGAPQTLTKKFGGLATERRTGNRK